MKPELKKELFTIPNLLTLIRVLCVPFIMAFILKQETITAFIILIVSSSTDLFDGYIARKYNQVSEFGKAFDPFADKFSHIMTMLCLCIIGYVHWIFVTLFLAKEITMLIVGAIVIKKRKIIIQAIRCGKNAALVMTIGMMMSFFHNFFAEKVFYLDWIVLGIGVALALYAFCIYAKLLVERIKKQDSEKLNQEKK